MEMVKRYLNRYDIILIIIILLLAGGIFVGTLLSSSTGGEAVVQVDGKMTGTYPLDEDREVEILGGENTLKIANGHVEMADATCPDQLCVNHKPISKSGESIICLPHKVVITVEGAAPSELDGTTN